MMVYSATKSFFVASALVFGAQHYCDGYHTRLPISFVRNLHHSTTNPSLAVSIDKRVPVTSLSSPVSRAVSCVFTHFTQRRKNPEFSVFDEGEDDDDIDIDFLSVDNDDDDDDDEKIEKLEFRQRQPSSDLLMVNKDAKSRVASLVDDDVDDDDDTPRTNNWDFDKQRTVRPHVEYAALKPGTVVQVQVGDLALARKAWKKRRRTGSPLLVPCSILNVDRQSMVRWNLIFLLEKFGQTTKDGVELSVASLVRWYRSYLRSSLNRHASELGYPTVAEMVKAVLNKRVQDSYGVFLEEKDDNVGDGTTLYLKAPLSRRKGQLRTANTPLLQFRTPLEGDHDFVGPDSDSDRRGNDHGSDSLTHTGIVRVLQDGTDKREYVQYPLSAALRVSQKDDIDSGRVSEGSLHAAVIFDYDKIGDGGSPLLTLSLNPGRVRESLKIKSDGKYKVIDKPNRLLKDLAVGDGPFKAKVVRLLGDKALVDLGVGRHVSTLGKTVEVLGVIRFKDSIELASDRAAAQAARRPISMPWVEYDHEEDEDMEDLIAASIDELNTFDGDDNYGEDEDDEIDDDEDEIEMAGDDENIPNDLLALRRTSSFEEGTFEEDEEEEDMTTEVLGSLFTENGDGSVTYLNPETGESEIISPDDEDYEDMMILKSLVDRGQNDVDETGEGEEQYDNDDEEDDEDEDDENVEDGAVARWKDSGDDEDISDDVIAKLFTTNEGGSISYHDPETGETLTVDTDDDEYDDMVLMKSLIDDYLPSTAKSHDQSDNRKSQEAAARTSSVEATPAKSSQKPRLVSKRLHVGDEIKVYVLGVSKQSNKLLVTTNRLVQGRKAKDLKKEAGAQKKKNRLKKQLGGSLTEIYRLTGKECDGTVKATSKAGQWLYVQPELDGLPVGVATMDDGEMKSISVGERVRVRIAGVDEERGQLSMQVISKLAP